MNKKSISSQDLSLVPLSIPTGWKVEYNQWFDFEPDQHEVMDPYLPDTWSWLRENLLHLKNENTGFILDLGWYPAENEVGEYGLELYRGQDMRQAPFKEFSSRSTKAIQEKVNHWLRLLDQPEIDPAQL